MRALLQRVTEARVTVGDEVLGQIGQGLLVLLCAEPADTALSCEKMLNKIIKLRIFEDDGGKMNRSLLDLNAGLLVVSQFTLAADTSKGNRPSYTQAADPVLAKRLYDHFLARAHDTGLPVASGRFAADMQVQLINDGPVTIFLEI